MSIKQTILNNRYRLIGSYLHFAEGTQGEKAKLLTQVAVEKGYIEPRSPVSGQKLKTWLKERNPPTWAIKAASKLLIETGFNPQEETEILSWAFYLREIGELESISSEQRQNLETALTLIQDVSI